MNKIENFENQNVTKNANVTEAAAEVAATGTKNGNKPGRKEIHSTSRFLGRGRGWTGFTNLKELYEFMALLGLETSDVAKKIGQTRMNVGRMLRADDAPVSILHNIATAFGYNLTLKYTVPEKRKVFEISGSVRLPKMALEEARGKRMFFLREAMQTAGVSASDVGEAVGFNRSSVMRWFAVDDFRISYAWKIAEAMGWKLNVSYDQMTVRERAAKRKTRKLSQECPEIKDIFFAASPQTTADRKFLDKLRKIFENHLSDDALTPEKLAKVFRTEAPLLHARIRPLLGIGTEETIEYYRLDRAA